MDIHAQHAQPILVHKIMQHLVQQTFVEQMILSYQMERAQIAAVDSNQMVASELVLKTTLLHQSIVMKDKLSHLMEVVVWDVKIILELKIMEQPAELIPVQATKL